MNSQELGNLARTIIDSNLYIVLGTANESGQPWVSPVYYASSRYTEFYWVSAPGVQHSQNIMIRPRISIVIFDSHAPIGTGQAVYMSAIAEEIKNVDLERGIEIFSRTSVAHGGKKWQIEDVSASSPYRLYRATVSEHWVRDPDSSPDRRTTVIL